MVGIWFEPADFTVDTHVTSVVDSRAFRLEITDPRAVDGWFTFGALTWTSGQNNGRAMEVKGYNGGTRETGLYLPMPRPVAVGDTCRIYAGCDKRHDTCRDKFNNIVNRRAEDFLPGFDAIIKTPNAPVG